MDIVYREYILIDFVFYEFIIKQTQVIFIKGAYYELNYIKRKS